MDQNILRFVSCFLQRKALEWKTIPILLFGQQKILKSYIATTPRIELPIAAYIISTVELLLRKKWHKNFYYYFRTKVFVEDFYNFCNRSFPRRILLEMVVSEIFAVISFACSTKTISHLFSALWNVQFIEIFEICTLVSFYIFKSVPSCHLLSGYGAENISREISCRKKIGR